MANPTTPFEHRPHRTFLALAVPVFGSLIAEPLTGLADTAFVARLGAEPLAALGVGTVLLSSIFWIFNFLGIATQTDVAQAQDETARTRICRTNAQAIQLSVAIGAAMALVGWWLAPWGCRLLGAEDRVLDLSALYLRIRLLGGPAVLASMAAFGTLRGLEDMRTPMWIALAVNTVNIGLDVALIPVYGVGGAAAASSAAQILGAAWAVFATIRRVGWTNQHDWREILRFLSVGGDLFVRTAALNAFLVIATRQATRAGAAAGAAHQAIRQSWMFTAFVLDAYAIAGQTLVAGFFGRKQIRQARAVARLVCGWSFWTGFAIGATMLAATPLVETWFVPPEARAVFRGAWILAAAAQPIGGLSFGTDGVHWGTGDFRYLRNAVALASAIGISGLALIDVGAPQALTSIWWAVALWNLVRATAGVMRIWPGIGAAPLRQMDSPRS